MAPTVRQMLAMRQKQLDELFLTGAPGPIPSGEAKGTAIIAPDAPCPDVAAKVIHVIAWQGKVFDAEHGLLRNSASPFQRRGVRAEVSTGESWFDSRDCIVLDYAHTSLVPQWVRDEMRELRPGMYLGIVYWEGERLMNFALEFPRAATP